jgi:hypothetical protein
MKTIIRWLNNRAALGILLVAGLATDLIMVGRAYNLSKSDWATWVGSLGTVATLIGTIYLAGTATRQRERQELITARLHAAGMTMRLSVVFSRIGDARRILRKGAEAGITPENLAKCHATLANIDMWKVNDLVPLVPLPENTAVKLAMAADQLPTVTRMAEHLATGFQQIQTQEIKTLVTTIDVMLAAICDMIAQATIVCSTGIAPVNSPSMLNAIREVQVAGRP